MADRAVMGDGSYDSRNTTRTNNSPANRPMPTRRPGDDPRFDSISGVFGPVKPAWDKVTSKPSREAEAATLAATKAAIVHFSAEMGKWGPELDTESNSQVSEGTGYEQPMQAIMSTFNEAVAQASRIDGLLDQVAENMRQRTLPEMVLLKGRYDNWLRPNLERAGRWVHGHDTSRTINLVELDKRFESFAKKIGVAEIRSEDRPLLEETVKQLEGAELSARFEDAQAAVRSVLAGNEADVSRIETEVFQLNDILSTAETRKAHGQQIAALVHACNKLDSTDPDVRNKLNVVHNALLVLSGVRKVAEESQ